MPKQTDASASEQTFIGRVHDSVDLYLGHVSLEWIEGYNELCEMHETGASHTCQREILLLNEGLTEKELACGATS